MFYISLVVSSIYFLLVAAYILGAKDVRNAYLKVWIGLPFCYLGMCVATGYLLHVVLTGVVGTLCWWCGASRRSFLYGATAVFVVAYALIGVPRIIELRQIERDYPFTSVDERLTYEPRRESQTANHQGQPPGDSPEFGRAWAENRRTAWRRERALEDLHSGFAAMFVTAPGFGIARMYPPTPDDIRRDKDIREAIPLPVPVPPEPGESPAVSTGELSISPSEPDLQAEGVQALSLREFHRDSAGEFLNPIGFGLVRDRRHVAGFLSHRFVQALPKLSAEKSGNGHWRVESLDLVSLLKHPGPVAYVSKHLPRMDELRDAPTRPLDEFEAVSLPRLRSGEELAAVQAPRRVRMLGALRARDECLKCHSVAKGDLLGAFSYDLRRDLPQAP